MPRLKTLRKTPRLVTFGRGHVLQITHGHDWFNDAWGRLTDDHIGDLRRAWPALKEKSMAENIEKSPGTRGLGWWLFESPAAFRPKTVLDAMEFMATSEARQILEDLGEITDEEKAELRRRASARTQGQIK